MYPLDENDLDRLSAEAAEHYHAPGTPSWDAVEQVLDIELPQKKDKRRRGLFFFLIFAGLFISGAAWWYFRQPAPASAIATTTVNKTIPAATQPTTTNTTTGTTNTVTNNVPKGVGAHDATPANHNLATAPVTANNSTTNNTTIKTTNKTAATTLSQPSVLIATKQSTAPVTKRSAKTTSFHNLLAPSFTSAAGDEPLAGNRNTGKPSAKKAGQPVAADAVRDAAIANGSTDVAATGNDQKTDPPVTAPASVAAPTEDKGTSATIDSVANATKVNIPAVTIPEIAKAADKADKKKKSPASGKAFDIGVTGGVDMSTIKFAYGDNVGYNIGIMGGYHFNKNWSVHTGAIYTKKDYKLEGDDYHSPIVNTSYNLETVDGNCLMWEVPVLGRYTFNSKTNTRVFLSGGLSSYFMEQEHYNYNYKYNGTPGVRSWTNNSSSNYWFSIVDFSAGVEKQLGPHLIGQVEPYARFPLAGIGFGKIQMSSFGVNVTLQYRKKIGK